jgi:hypothetical protein
MSAAQAFFDALADAEREVQKLRKLLVRHLCDCRKMSLERPLEPTQHRLTCRYRRDLDDNQLLRHQAE